MSSFASLRDLVSGFANALNLINPDLQNHHERVSYLAWQLARQMNMDEPACGMAFFGALTHDIGLVLRQGDVSLRDLERDALALSRSGAALLRSFPMTLSFSEAVRQSQTPWLRLRALPERLRAPQRIGQIIHLADDVAEQLREGEPVLNQLSRIRERVDAQRDGEYSGEVVDGFDRLCQVEYVWMDLLYRPQLFLDFIPDDRGVSLDDTILLSEFMSRIIDFRSPFTAMHSAGVAATAVELAGLMGMSEDERKMMRIAGSLHDVGKLRIPNEILEKPGKLTDEEFNVMKEHAYYTHTLLRDVKGFEQIAAWAALHHEKLNGAGYPFHLSAEQLPLGARIMAVADVFSAISEDRPYRKGMAKDRALDVLREDAGRGMLSGDIVELLAAHYDAINASRDRASRAASRKYRESLKNS